MKNLISFAFSEIRQESKISWVKRFNKLRPALVRIASESDKHKDEMLIEIAGNLETEGYKRDKMIQVYNEIKSL